MPIAARSRTSGYIILGATRGRRTPPPGAGSRSPAPATGPASSPRATPSTPSGSRPGGPRPRRRPGSASGVDRTQRPRSPSRSERSAPCSCGQPRPRRDGTRWGTLSACRSSFQRGRILTGKESTDLGAVPWSGGSVWVVARFVFVQFERITVGTSQLSVVAETAGPPCGWPVLLLHGFPYDPWSYVAVADGLAAAGGRVVAPYLRGFGPTRFLPDVVSRTGQQAAIGRDAIEVIDGLGLGSAVVVGFDWGGRAACIAAALWPERIGGLVAIGGYEIQDIGGF